MKKKITLTLNLEDTIIVDENDDIDYVKDEMLYIMHDYELLYEDHLIDYVAYHSAMNDLYLLALLHTICEE